MSKQGRVNIDRVRRDIGEGVEVIQGPPPFDPMEPVSRAVGRAVMMGNDKECVECGEVARFRAKDRTDWLVVANVYEEGVWQNTEFYYPPSCYVEAGAPYGPIYTQGVLDSLPDQSNQTKPETVTQSV